MDLISPSFALLGFVIAGGDIAALAGVSLGWVDPRSALVWLAATALLGVYLAIAPLLTASRARAYGAILREAPRFALLKLRTYASLLAGRGDRGWIRTER